MSAPRTPDYDFFAPTAAAPAPDATATATGRVGVPAPGWSGGAVNQFGTPVGASPAPVQTAPAPHRVQRVRAAVPGWVWRVGISLVVAVVLGLFGVGRFAGFFERDLTTPDSLGGYALRDDEVSLGVADLLSSSLGVSGVDDGDMAVGVYGTDTQGAVLMAVRQRTSPLGVEGELARFGPITQVGQSSCALADDGSGTVCVREGGDLTVVVMVLGVHDVAEGARLTTAAWDGF